VNQRRRCTVQERNQPQGTRRFAGPLGEEEKQGKRRTMGGVEKVSCGRVGGKQLQFHLKKIPGLSFEGGREGKASKMGDERASLEVKAL